MRRMVGIADLVKAQKSQPRKPRQSARMGHTAGVNQNYQITTLKKRTEPAEWLLVERRGTAWGKKEGKTEDKDKRKKWQKPKKVTSCLNEGQK